ncbi:outer membrane protein OmpA-like peptidoglycan-associated protein [Saonia flava]|uniref:Outer membrane protein OmpA-like peptidoglycan-associated protein n=1 Tax=Saonia flava TaxID=523696 RepID=A0A846QNH7_9FLAO|nr:OmpA family protein [Saonia flava]NJB69678.1 outer membrane protein OmpA-like peptidoglycan-associated protein [Saonia flava]
MKKVLFILSLFTFSISMAQDLPTNPEPGKCYVRCTTPDVYVNETVTFITKPAYKVLKTYPATFKTVTERVLVKEESKKLTVVAAKWGTETVSYVSKEGGNSLSIIPASFRSASETIEIKPAYAQWELGSPAPDCASGNPDDCRYWCYKGYPAEYTTVQTQVLGSDASTTKSPLGSQNAVYTKRVLLEPAKVVEVVIPAEYKEITKTVLDKDAYTVEESIPAVTKTITKEVLKDKGGLTSWKEVECSLVEYQALPINWNLGSATLTSAAKTIIDTRLMPVLKQNPGAKLEIASHTDARGTSSSNQDLSDRRAKAVADYLISKGVNSSLLVANGYGEQRLKNRCADGVSCTERDHSVNRRTEFRLINN